MDQWKTLYHSQSESVISNSRGIGLPFTIFQTLMNLSLDSHPLFPIREKIQQKSTQKIWRAHHTTFLT
jgi:hypothetical protein